MKMQAIWNGTVVAESDQTIVYRHPLPLARRVRNRVAFWHGVQVVPARDQHEANR